MSTTPLPKEQPEMNAETVTSTQTTACGCKYISPNSYDPSYDDGCGWGAYCPGSSIHDQACSDEAPCPSHLLVPGQNAPMDPFDLPSDPTL